jgi:dolichol-phosphate mannosyltransferase
MRTTICLPTYNERENLEPMLRALGSILREGDRVLVVDDSSPDGTGALADSLSRDRDWLSVLHRERKEGLGPAYLAGFAEALRGGAELVVAMDCDFSHDPAAVPSLIEAAEQGADLVLGSRYVEGGSIPAWGRGRRAVSAIGNQYARLLLRTRLRDLTGGFKCYRRSVLEALLVNDLKAKGYAFQIETTYRALAAGFTVTEVPIAFVEREAGSSKMSGAIVAEAIWRVPLLKAQHMVGWSGFASGVEAPRKWAGASAGVAPVRMTRGS